jgi:hypothetical protein
MDSSFFRTTFADLLIVTLVYIFIRRAISFTYFSTTTIIPWFGSCPILIPTDFVQTCFYPRTLLTLRLPLY